MGEYIQLKTLQFFKLKFCFTFADLIFEDITPFVVGSGSEGQPPSQSNFWKISLLRLPLIAKRCAGDELR